MSDSANSSSANSSSAMSPNNVAVITGGASGIGLAAAMRFARFGMKVAIADIGADRLTNAEAQLSKAPPGGAASVMTMEVDVSRLDAVIKFESAVRARFGGTDILMNNAGIGPGSQMFGPRENWERILGVNLWGIINGVHTFAPALMTQGTPAVIVNTGSKQGITCPPGDTAYNVSKAGVKAMTEGLQHVLRSTPGCQVSAHLLVPGWTFTGLTARSGGEKPAGAWWPEQVIDYLLEALGRGDFYILCPDNDVTRAVDERRILWAAGDLVENRPPLSRWHPEYKDAFAEFLARR